MHTRLIWASLVAVVFGCIPLPSIDPAPPEFEFASEQVSECVEDSYIPSQIQQSQEGMTDDTCDAPEDCPPMCCECPDRTRFHLRVCAKQNVIGGAPPLGRCNIARQYCFDFAGDACPADDAGTGDGG